ncbi:hypothetical protein FSARC_8138 [Fusarium sarcochroum]|uniref:Tryptophan--tRNA ligase, mitochondrial n=1 Tax=Fusarium sarcochroum TaxID=1208366 RepID=A0A8H4TTM2_9HYPO|nr:hypothetical protein FSARC_8138 [Fusarium sarcochroum]
MPKVPRVIFSGIQPTGVPHLGNYVGALRQWVQLQHSEPDTKLVYSIVDLHAITMPQPPEQLRKRKREALAALLAIGIDPERATLFYQSSVPAHSELMWILSCTASVGYLSRMTQWKVSQLSLPLNKHQNLTIIKSKLNLNEKSSIDDRQAGSCLKLGLFSYPVLQAADILVHRATHVPVGHDQQQHLEFARECVTNFNAAYGNHLVSPQTLIPPVHRVMSLNDPTSKMSKSHKSEKSRILITDSPEDIKAKIGSAKTDSIPGITYAPDTRPGISNLLDILSIFDAEGKKGAQLAEQYGDISPKQLKDMVTDAVIGGLDGIRDRYLGLLGQGDERLDSIESIGAQKAQKSADETMQIVRDAVGL